MIEIAERIKDVEEYYFATKLREIRLRQSQGENILNLGIGSPDLPPHPKVIEALSSEAKNEQSHGYQPYKGIPELRKAFAEWLQREFDVRVDPETEILPLIGSKEGIMHISMSFLDEGDIVLVPNPGYPTYASASKLSGANVHYYALEGARPRLEDIEPAILEKAKIMWISYPHMPTGVNATKAEVSKVLEYAQKYKFLICHDNPYNQVLTESPISIFQLDGFKEFGIELHSLSKSMNMAGWRMGFMLADKYYINSVLKFKSNMDSGQFKPLQAAAVEALKMDNEFKERLNMTYSARKDLGLALLRSLGCKIEPDQSGMFIWAEIPEEFSNSHEFSEMILNRYLLFITPGAIFGSEGDRFVRLSLCSSREILKESLRRITEHES